jgi:hypothetical protein
MEHLNKSIIISYILLFLYAKETYCATYSTEISDTDITTYQNVAQETSEFKMSFNLDTHHITLHVRMSSFSSLLMKVWI